MGWRRRIFVRTIALGAISLAGAAAEAGELIVMPYACSVVNGQPQLTPSDDRGYSVVGRREERDFSACSPTDPTLCKRWKLFRFDIDCGGKRIPWIDVAAGGRRDGRAWVERGRLRIEMPARWGMRPDDACARSVEGEGPYGGGFRRFCAERRADNAPPIIEMPDGFAPMMGLNGIFVADNGQRPGPGAGAGGSRYADEGPGGEEGGRLQWKASPVPPPRFAQSSETAQPRREAGEPTAKKPVTHTAAAEPSSKSSPESAAKASAKATRTADATPPANNETSNLDVKPKIINSKSAGKMDPFSSSETPESATSTTPPAEQSTVAAAPPPAAPLPAPAVRTSAATAPPAPAPAPAAQPPAPAAGPPPATPAPSPVVTASITKSSADAGETASIAVPAAFSALGPGTISAAALLALTLLALTYYQLRSRSGLDAHANRDIGSLSLDGHGRELVIQQQGSVAETKTATPPAPSGFRPDVSNEIPATRADALQILGMGVASDVSDAAIKKIVDGLRMSWHPDAATTDEDRRLRELRIKQVNAAWEIISGRRPS